MEDFIYPNKAQLRQDYKNLKLIEKASNVEYIEELLKHKPQIKSSHNVAKSAIKGGKMFDSNEFKAGDEVTNCEESIYDEPNYTLHIVIENNFKNSINSDKYLRYLSITSKNEDFKPEFMGLQFGQTFEEANSKIDLRFGDDNDIFDFIRTSNNDYARTYFETVKFLPDGERRDYESIIIGVTKEGINPNFLTLNDKKTPNYYYDLDVNSLSEADYFNFYKYRKSSKFNLIAFGYSKYGCTSSLNGFSV